MDAAQAIQGIGTGGLLYIVAPDGTTIVQTLVNAPINYTSIRQLGAISAPLGGQTRAYGVINITAVAGVGLDMTVLTIDGVSQIAAAVALTNADIEASAESVATAINASIPGAGADYSAVSIGGVVYVVCNTPGSAVNGHVLSATFDVGVTATTLDVNGGINGNEVTDAQSGFRFFIDTSAVLDADLTTPSLSNATEISYYIILRGMNSGAILQTVSGVSSGKITVERRSQTMQLLLNTGSPSAAVAEIIVPGVQLGDELILTGYSAASSALFSDYTAGTDNLRLANGSNYLSQFANDVLVLRWANDATTGYAWYEISRSNKLPATPSEMRGISIPFSPNGVKSIPLISPADATGGYAFLPQTDSHVAQLTSTGAVALGANFAITFAGTPIAGDVVFISGNTVAVTIGAFVLSVNGVAINSTWALSGRWLTRSRYTGAAWVTELWADSNPLNTLFILDSMIAGMNGSKLTAASIIAGKYGALSIATADIAAQAITTAKIAVGNITTALLDATLQASLGVIYQIVPIVIPTASVLTLFTVPIQVVPAQGANTTAQLVGYAFYMPFNTTPYATNTSLRLRYIGGSTIATDNNTLVSGVTHLTTGTVSATGIVAPFVNTGIEVFINTGDPTAGDSDITVYAFYRILPT